jgi:hypothetical protein
MELSLSTAAKTTGKGKSTIHRAIKSGKLSARKTEDGAYLIDTSELARVFQLNVPAHVSGTPREAQELLVEPLGAEVASLRARVAGLEELLAREREAVAREQESVDDLRKRLDRAEERVHALTHQPREQPQPVGLLRRIFRR